MSDSNKIRIGIASARELELEVEDPDAVSEAFEEAIKKGEQVLWLNDTRGHRFGISVATIAFIEVDQPIDRGVGFGPT